VKILDFCTTTVCPLNWCVRFLASGREFEEMETVVDTVLEAVAGSAVEHLHEIGDISVLDARRTLQKLLGSEQPVRPLATS
jgi:hypothetical protein